MKHLFAVTILILSFVIEIDSQTRQQATPDKTKNLWEQVDSLERNGQPRSALVIIDQIFEHSRKAQNTNDYIRALVFKLKFSNETSEEALAEFLQNIDSELAELWCPARQIAHAFVAEMFQNYYLQNRWKILSKRELASGSQDVRKMSASELSKKAVTHYLQSISEREVLASELVEKYKPVLDGNIELSVLRPTLYDLLMAKTAQQLLNGSLFDTPDVSKYQFDDSALLGDLDTFLSASFGEPDIDEPAVLAIKVLQEWLRFRKNAGNLAALLDADLTRLDLLHKHTSDESQRNNYEQNLMHLAYKSQSIPEYTRVLYHHAKLLMLMSEEVIGKRPDRNYKQEILSLAEKAMRRYPKSEGAKLLSELKKSILAPVVTLVGENETATGVPYFYVVETANISTLHTYLYKLSLPDDKKLSHHHDEAFIFNQIKELQPLKTEKHKIPDFGYYMANSSELMVQLPSEPGIYALLVSNAPFNKELKEMEVFQLITFQATNLRFFERKDDAGTRITVTDRTTGQPIHDVSVKTRTSNRFNAPPVETLHPATDKDGVSLIKYNSANYNNFNIIVSKNKDTYFSETRWWGFQNQDYKPTYRNRIFFFTDRKIYRPGQTIYFKGILLSTDNKDAQALNNEQVEISLRDVNGRELYQQTYKTNDFGSVSGTFTLPNSVLTGGFTLQSPFGSTYFQVEEYKRPRFEVTFEPFKQVALLDDDIEITAKAMTLTNIPLQGAKAEWHVKRYTSTWWRHFRQTPISVASGNGIIDDNGQIIFSFKALADKKHLAFNHNFEIIIDVTDINGETRTATQNISLGQEALHHYTETKESFINPKNIPVTFHLQNKNGQGVSGEIRYKVLKLKVPETLLPSRFWDKPDTVLWSAENKYFDSFGQEAWRQYEVESVIVSGTLEVNEKLIKQFATNDGIVPGYYRIETEITDKSGKILKSASPFRVIETDDKAYTLSDGLAVLNLNDTIKPGDSAQFMVGSIFSDGKAFVLVSNNNNLLIEKSLPLNKTWHTISIPVTSKMTGLLTVNVVTVRHNRIYVQSAAIRIIDPAKDLNVRLTSFRDKVEPGDKETWELTIADGNNQPAETETLALMYDASLDYYAANQLHMNPFIQEGGSVNYTWPHSGSNYGTGISTRSISISEPKPYPSFFWPSGLGFVGHPNLMVRAKSSKVMLSEGLFLAIAEDNVAAENAILFAQDGVAQDMESAIEEQSPTDPKPQVRSRLQETAFFLPHIRNSENGKAVFSFTMPESVTRWRFMALSHRKDGISATTEQFITASKKLMVVPSLPRIVREGDRLYFSASIINNSAVPLWGLATITLKDAITGKLLSLSPTVTREWATTPNGIAGVSWEVIVPNGIKGLEATISATSGDMSDGEKHLIPVLPSRVMVTETLPVTLNKKGRHQLRMNPLSESRGKRFEKFTFTYTQNAAWEVLGALPWLMERPNENTDQIFNRIFAVTMTGNILKQHPQIERVLKAWAALPDDEDAIASAMERNPELKSALLSATTWLTEAQSDSERRRRMASLINSNQLESEQTSAISLLQNMQLENGAWPWFSGMWPSEQTTTNIVAGFGYMKKAGISLDQPLDMMVERAIGWLQEKLSEQQKELEKAKRDSAVVVNAQQLQLLYALSFFTEGNPSETEQFWLQHLKSNPLQGSVMAQSLAAIVSSRHGNKAYAHKLLVSLEEKLIFGEHATRHFVTPSGPYWHQAPVETHVTALEAFHEITPNEPAISGIENWLIQQKRTQSWTTTRATVSAVYALASSTRELLTVNTDDKIKAGNQTLKPEQRISGTGFIAKTWTGNEIKPQLGKITINKGSNAPSWTSMHLSYYEEGTDVKEGGFLSVNRTIYKRVLKAGVQEWQPVLEGEIVTIGDRLMVRVVVETPQALDFVHVKAPRAATLEPADLLSGYRFQSGLGYYLSITDAGYDMFIDHLPKGTFSLTWEMTVSHRGTTGNGPVAVSCYYAPEFSGHSEGLVIQSE
jgi:hypothetical protein